MTEHIKNDNKTNNLQDRVKVELEGANKVAITVKAGGKAYAKRCVGHLREEVGTRGTRSDEDASPACALRLMPTHPLPCTHPLTSSQVL